MKSDLPKVLHPLGNRPMIHFVLDALEQSGIQRFVIVVGYRAELVREAVADRDVEFALQTEQLGTGHAVKMCQEHLSQHAGSVAVVTGDSPMIQSSSLSALLKLYDESQPACILGTAHKPDPTGLGRILRDAEGQFAGIIEEKEANDVQKQITEVNMSTYVFDCEKLQYALQHINNDNNKGEYYITDCPGVLLNAGFDVRALDILQPCESLSINTVNELAAVEQEMRRMGYF